MIKRFRYEFLYDDDNDDRCILRDQLGYCFDKKMKCKGRLEDRPGWCPLIEVKGEFQS